MMTSAHTTNWKCDFISVNGSARCVNKTLCAFNRTKLNTVSNEPYDLFIAVCLCVRSNLACEALAWLYFFGCATISNRRSFRSIFDIRYTLPFSRNHSITTCQMVFRAYLNAPSFAHAPTVSGLVCRSLSQFISDAIHLYQKLISRTHQRAISSLRLDAEFMNDDRRGVGWSSICSGAHIRYIYIFVYYLCLRVWKKATLLARGCLPHAHVCHMEMESNLIQVNKPKINQSSV